MNYVTNQSGILQLTLFFLVSIFPIVVSISVNRFFGTGAGVMDTVKLGIIPLIVSFCALFAGSAVYDHRRSRSKRSFVFGMIIMLAVLFVTNMFFLWLSCIGFDRTMRIVIFGIMMTSAFIAMTINRSTEDGAKKLGKVMGFRNFIANAEYERIKILSEENPQYFYEILPYAQVLGMRSRWAEKFEDIIRERPSWYHSEYKDIDRWTPMYMADQMSHICNTYEAASKSSSDKGSNGGHGGGGFSGGGGGGGGGGAW